MEVRQRGSFEAEAERAEIEAHAKLSADESIERLEMCQRECGDRVYNELRACEFAHTEAVTRMEARQENHHISTVLEKVITELN